MPLDQTTPPFAVGPGDNPPRNTGAPFGQTAVPFGQTSVPFGQTAPPFGQTNAPFGAGPAARNQLPNYASAHGQEELTLSDVGPLIRQLLVQIRARWILALVSAVTVTAGAAWLIFHNPADFVAETTMLAQSPLDKILNTTDASNSGISADPGQLAQENALRNHMSVMTSRTFYKKLEDGLTADEKAAVLAPYPDKTGASDEDRLFGLFDKNIDIERERGRDFYTIDVRHRNADVATMLAERFTAQYLDYLQSVFRKASQDAMGILKKQADDLSNEMRGIEDRRREYRKTYNLISVEENQSIISERLRRINAALSDVRVMRVGAETQLQQAKVDMALTPTPYNNSVLATFGNTPDLRAKLDSFVAERDVLATVFGPNHPKMIEANGQIEGVKRTIVGNFQTALADLQSKYEIAVASEKQLNDELTSAFNQSLDIDKLASSFNTLGDELDAKQKTQTELLKHIADTAISGQMPANVMSVVDPAFLKPFSLKRLLLLVALLMMLFGGTFVGTPILMHLFDEKLSASADLETVLGKELLGAVPRLSKTRTEDRPHIVRDNVDFGSVEAFLSIVGQFDLISKKPMPRRLIVTSTLPGEGKSMAASNLASTYTRLGRRTLLADFDFRRPTQSVLQQIPMDTRGVLNWAAAGFPESPDLFQVGGPLGIISLPDGTHFLPSGGTDPQPTRYLIAAGMAQMFEQLSGEFDIVIIDTPPAGVFQDALILAKYSHETILIARDGKAQTAQVQRVIADLEKTPSPVVGVVLNAFAPGATHPHMAYRHLAEKYGYGYGYGKGEKGEKAKPVAGPGEVTKAAKELAAS
jgi:succinoglycan biosynthesis transport protein ExoP